MRVRSGDPDNVEAQAARRYWPLLFADAAFRRDAESPGVNQWLNYAYAIVRSVIARAVCGAGLHPSFGLHHRNRYNAFCLADDLMEPYRPHADVVVAAELRERGSLGDLDPASKAFLVAEVMAHVRIDGSARPLPDAAAATAVSLAQVFAGERRSLLLPES
ncbi:MAG: CRISPR-associated endonuclease Cas1 [Planctomycetes bacterium]|nr:CRISPR-associated endonuclease Cas1 [Planctomycetota bacterium]